MNLPHQTIERIRAVLEASAGVVSAYLFGSLAGDRGHRESDIDIGVLFDRDIYGTAAERFEVRLRLIAALQPVAGRAVDLVILNDAAPHLARHIMCDGRALVVRDAARDHAYRRLMLSRAADLEPFLRRMRALKLEALRR